MYNPKDNLGGRPILHVVGWYDIYKLESTLEMGSCQGYNSSVIRIIRLVKVAPPLKKATYFLGNVACKGVGRPAMWAREVQRCGGS